MNRKFKNLIVVLVLGFIFVEFGYQIIQSDKEIEAKNPIGLDGRIKDGSSISIKEQEEMEISSYPSLTDREYAENMLFAFGKCLMSASSVGEGALLCLSNNVDDKALYGLSAKESDFERGQYILEKLSKGKKITNILVKPNIKKDTQKLNFTLSISYDYDSEIAQFALLITDRKISSITLLTEGDKENEKNY